jgi:holo-[acyl-carrier protein] synthase
LHHSPRSRLINLVNTEVTSTEVTGTEVASGGGVGAIGLVGPSGLVGLGIDMVDVARFADVLARRPQLAERLFTQGERTYAGTLANPAQSLAARFAAKEAAMKALGVGLGAFAFGEVEVQRQPSGLPHLVLSGRAARLASERQVRSWMVSLTHTSSTAAAVVVALA